MPDKGMSKSQYVVRQKIKQEKLEKEQRKAKSKKKFINMALNTKKFNGVITYSDYALSSQNNADNVSKRDSFSNLATTTNIESGGDPLVVNG